MVYILINILHILPTIFKTVLNDDKELDIYYMSLEVKPLERGTVYADSTV